MSEEKEVKTGRPSIYSEELANAICARLAQDESLVSICKDEGMPSTTTVHRWRDEMPPFRANYARARVEQGHFAADEMGRIRKKLEAGELDHQTATALANILKWEAGKRAPKDFGEKLELEHSGTLNMPPDARQAEIDRLLAKRAGERA